MTFKKIAFLFSFLVLGLLLTTDTVYAQDGTVTPTPPMCPATSTPTSLIPTSSYATLNPSAFNTSTPCPEGACPTTVPGCPLFTSCYTVTPPPVTVTATTTYGSVSYDNQQNRTSIPASGVYAETVTLGPYRRCAVGTTCVNWAANSNISNLARIDVMPGYTMFSARVSGELEVNPSNTGTHNITVNVTMDVYYGGVSHDVMQLGTFHWQDGGANVIFPYEKIFTATVPSGQQDISIRILWTSNGGDFTDQYDYRSGLDGLDWIKGQGVWMTPTPTAAPCVPGSGAEIDDNPIITGGLDIVLTRSACYTLVPNLLVTLPTPNWVPFNLPPEIGIPGIELCISYYDFGFTVFNLDIAGLLGAFCAIIGAGMVYKEIKS